MLVMTDVNDPVIRILQLRTVEGAENLLRENKFELDIFRNGSILYFILRILIAPA